MTADDYTDSLRAVLSTTDDDVRRRLALIADAADDGAIDVVVLDVFVDDDAEGPFDVWARFEGESVFVTQQRLGDERQLVDVVWSEHGWTPAVPARPSDWSRSDLLAAIIDVVATWLAPLLPASAAARSWSLETPDGETDPRDIADVAAAG